MPIFSKAFDVKSVPIRGKRANEDCPILTEKTDDFRSISINLSRNLFRLQDGRWMADQRHSIAGSGDNDDHDVIALKRQTKKLEQTNHLCQIKIEVLLDMLTQQRLNG